MAVEVNDDRPDHLVKRGSARGLDMCKCCWNLQLSFCCDQCNRNGANPLHGNLFDTKSRDENMVSAGKSEMVTSNLATRVGKLRNGACACCRASQSRRCCVWCGNMNNLLG